MNKLEIELFGVDTDCGDGSHSFNLYKDEATAKKHIAENHGVKVEEVDFDDDPYRWGYTDTVIIEFELVDGELSMIGDKLFLGNFG